jgi:hypothetical protein
MGVLYYVPARRFDGGRMPDVLKPSRLAGDGVSLEGVGLGHLDGAPLSFRGVRNNGPDGGAGLVVGLRSPANETGVFAGQRWQPCAGGDVFILMDNGQGTMDNGGGPAGDRRGVAPGENTAGTAVPHSFGNSPGRPGPEVFLRGDALPSVTDVVMADGNAWGFVPTKALPEVMRLDGAGELCWMPRARDAAHFEASAWLMDFLLAEGETRPYVDTLARVAVCLGARYHVSLMEVQALGLFSTDLLTRIVCACVGIDFDEVVGKKNEGAGASTG